MDKRYPPPHPVFLKEYQDVMDELRRAREEISFLRDRLFKSEATTDVLYRRLNGATSDPWQDTHHPGHLLTKLGWRHVPEDKTGLNWIDPLLEDGVEIYRTLPEALGVACQRILSRLSRPTVLERIAEEDTAD